MGQTEITRSHCQAVRALTALVGTVAILVSCLTFSATAQELRESHHWIVLLDVSASFEGREREQSEELGRDRYRLRNEALALLQTLLAAQRVKERDLRDDRLTVYAFGEGVKAVEELSAQPVRWADVNDPDWWEERIPGDLGARTDYFEALRQAVEDFQGDRPGTVQHLIVISDGELDVGSQNRNPRTPPGSEEMERYRNLLRRDVDPLNWLHDQRVEVSTLAVDEELNGYNDEARQKEIRSTLYQYLASGGPAPLERALALVEDFSGRIDEDGKMPQSEGPYVLTALAQAFSGEARSVRHDNVLEVLWETLFPEQESHRILPPGTDDLVVFAPRSVPIPIEVEIEGERQELALRYDEERDSYWVEPSGRWEGLRVNVHSTDQYATWLIHHPGLREVDPVYRVAGQREERRFSFAAVPNVVFEWREDEPPEQILARGAIPLSVDLRWNGQPPEPSRDEWRSLLRNISLPTEGEVELPNGDVEPVSFSPIVADDVTQVVLRLEGEYSPRLEGAHEARVVVYLGSDPEAAPLRAHPVRFDVVTQSPLSDEDRFLLHLRRWEAGEPAEAIPLRHETARGSDPVILSTGSDDPVTVLFEWWGKLGEDCQGVDRLRLRVPEFDRVFTREQNEIDGAPPREGNWEICYRSPGLVIEAGRFGEAFTVEAGDGLVNDLWWRFRVERPSRLWRWIALALGALLGALLVLFLLRDRIQQVWTGMVAPFPLALDLGDEGSIVWRKGEPKRLLLIADSNGDLSAELTRRKLETGESAVEIVPDSAETYLIRPLAEPGSSDPDGWSIRRSRPGDNGSSNPLAAIGEQIHLSDLTRQTKVRLTHGERSATLRYQSAL